MKNLKDKLVTEREMSIYPEDWGDMKNEDDVISGICNALEQCKFYDSICISIENSLDPHMFYDKNFQKKLSETLGNSISEYYDDYFG